jgi:hypothetical protein
MVERTVWKYKINVPVCVEDTVHMPLGAEILHIDRKDEDVYLWALVNPRNELEARTFFVLATGRLIEGMGSIEHIGTLLSPSKEIVLHVFEKTGSGRKLPKSTPHDGSGRP